jgi:hypothetical protein
MSPGKPYGSVYTRNIARLLWEVQKAQTEGESKITVAMRNEKINRGMLHRRHGYNITYHNEQAIDEDGESYSEESSLPAHTKNKRFTQGVP